MFRTIIAATALTGVLAMGGAGVASATTSTPATTATHCAKAPAVLNRIAKFEAKANTFETKLEGRLATATAANNTKAETRIQNRIDRVKKWEGRGTTLTQKINAKCPGVTATPAS